jgi:hypothetical protein
MNPPNSCHLLVYLGVLDVLMGDHRNNFKNSQVDGSSVIIFSRCNRPMVIRMTYAATPDRHGDKRDDYITSFAYQMTCGNDWVTVLDPVDDLMMRHGLSFATEKTEGEFPHKNESWRDAWVIRWLAEEGDFLVDTCGLLLSEAMEEYYGQDSRIDDEYPQYVRGIFT